jgi:Zn-dependent M28 family amino/carboxypeptidase
MVLSSDDGRLWIILLLFIRKSNTVIKKHLLLLLIFASTFAQAQKLKKEDKQTIANLQTHIQYLADDKLEGRRTGTPGEKLAAKYISNEFKKIGLQPKGVSEFFQPFEVNEGKQIDPSTYLTIDGKILTLDKDFFPLIYSANATVEALPSLTLQEPKMPWFYNLKELLETNASNPHFNLNEAVMAKAQEAAEKGATAFFIYNTSTEEDGLRFDDKERVATISIPVVYITTNASKKYFADESATLDIKLKTSISEKKRNGENVIGLIDNGAPTTVILGAHFDHLGYGEDGNAREVASKHQIYNGADDNASGVAALIELAHRLKESKLKNNNYLFIAFSGEELGLLGSKYFIEHSPIDLNTINYMINMDMVGRLSDSAHVLTVGGYGTSPSWGVFYNQKGKNKLYKNDMAFRFDSSGTGPSDHTSFYLKNIPVLFYFTGLHSDYHKPTDDYNKINYAGEMDVVKHIYSLIEAADKQKEKLRFSKTRETSTTTSARFSVTLGIMPDYAFAGAGVRVDGVSDNKPAQKAGLQTGDIITALGDVKVTSLESYMQALGKFKKGDKAIVGYTRANKPFSTTVEF